MARPPSTRSSSIGVGIASMISRTRKAIASRAARAICARVVPVESPAIIPRGCESQCGAPIPASAGSTATPPLSAAELASWESSAPSPASVSSETIQSISAPAVNTPPSIASAVGESAAAVSSRPAGGVWPAIARVSTNAPVP